MVKVKEPRGSPSTSVGAGHGWRHSEGLCILQGPSRQQPPLGASTDPPRALRPSPAGLRCWRGGGSVPVDAHLRRPPLLPRAQLPPSGNSNTGLQEELAPGQRGADTLPPKGLPPHPQEQAQQDAVRGSLEAFREERRPGTSPAGKEVSWVCHSVCRSPDSRPRRLSTNGVCVGADGRRTSRRQEPKGEGRAAGERQQVGRSAEQEPRSNCKPQV